MRLILDPMLVDMSSTDVVEQLNAMALKNGLTQEQTIRFVDAARRVAEEQPHMFDGYEVSFDFVDKQIRVMAVPLKMPRNRTRRR